MFRKIKKNQKGSAMVFAIVLITNALVLISSMVFLTIIQNKSSANLHLTTKAFQQADSGLEHALKKIFESDVLVDSIDDLNLCDGGFNNEGKCSVVSPEVSIWFFDENEDIIIDEFSLVDEIESLKVMAKVSEGSNVVSRAFKVVVNP